MYAEEQRRRSLNILANLIIWVFETVSFGLVWFGEYHNPLFFKGNYAVILLYGLFMYLITKSFHGYKLSYMRVMDLCLSHMLTIITGGGVAYIFICMVSREYMNVVPVLVMCLVQIVFTTLWVALVQHLYLYFFPPRRLIVIYGNYPPEAFLQKINARSDRYRICEVLNYHKGLQKIQADVLDFEGVVLYDMPAEDRNSLIKYCFKHSIRTYVVPKISDIIMKNSDDLHLVDTPVFLSRNMGLTADQRFVKRFMDILISGIGIIIASPIMLVIAIVIKLYDRGPVLYRQIRLTRGGKEFNICKFRSMRMDAEKDGAQLAKKDDDRVTPVGKVLRNLHLDELPQLFNVFVGDMSMVGPRPERPEIFDKYEKSVPDFDFRLKVKAGLTGYAQVYGKYNTTPIDKLKLDLTYIQGYSYWMDLKLLFLTFRIVFRKESSEGVAKEQTTALDKKEEKK